MLVGEFATMCLGATWVPIFSGYPVEQLSSLLARTRPTVVVVSWRDQLVTLRLPIGVRLLVTVGAVHQTDLEAVLAGTNTAHATYADALEAHRVKSVDGEECRAFLRLAARVDPAEPALMCFTSGTSGALKGVVLTHDNILSQQRALAATWPVTPQDRLLSYLPWHHSFGGIFEKYTALYNGATIHVDDSRGKDFARLVQNWKAVKPTLFFSVPAIYQQLVAHAEAYPAESTEIFHSGLRYAFTAAAPLPATLSAFLASRNVRVLEGWGLTETSPCCTLTDPGEPRTVPGLVGYPIPGVTLALADDGEVLVRGPNVMPGYFDDRNATDQALPGDGWFHTGDLGELVGTALRIVARKDRVFKLMNAEKVQPTEIENRLAGMNPFIRHVIVMGQGRDHLSALIFPDYFRIVAQFGADRVAAERAVGASLRETIATFNRDHPVGYERILAFAVVSRELAIETNELTPSLKVRVTSVLEQTVDYQEALYAPSAACDCRFLRKVMRLVPDGRPCVAGQDRTLDQCHACGGFVFDAEPPGMTEDTTGAPR
jgi:long-subunit acyl-CoA synthetase (AMP-forming)